MDPRYFPVEGCAPERPTAFERLAKNSPSTAVLIEYAEQNGYLKAENRYVRGEAQAFERKLNEAEEREVDATNSRDYYRRQNDRTESYAAELEQTVAKLEKKLAPKKTAKKTNKVAKKAK